MSVLSPYQRVFQSVVSMPQSITIDLASRYAVAFGINAISNQFFVANRIKNTDYGFDFYPQNNEHEQINLSIPGVDQLTFGSVITSTAGSFLAPPPLLVFKQQKSLIETPVNDSDAVVVERWGTEPWEVRITGLLIDLSNRIYPSDEIRRLNRVWKHNGVIEVVGQQFEEKDIDSLYFKSIEFTGVEGYQDTIRFSIEARSIKAVNFSLLKPFQGSVEVGNLDIINIEV